MKFEIILSKVQSIRDIINLRLGEIDAGPLGNNPLSNSMTEVMLSQMIREVSKKVIDKKVSEQLSSTGRSMMHAAMDGLTEGYEEGDDICPPYFHPHFWPHFGPRPEPWFNNVYTIAGLNPQPLPPLFAENLFKEFGGAGREVMIAETLRIMASLTVNADFNEDLKNAALYVMRGAASGKAYDDFENRCGSTGPRIPFPHKRQLADVEQ